MQKPRSPANENGGLRASAKPYVTVYGYARVSTGRSSVDAQVRQPRPAGVGKVFREVASGAGRNFAACLTSLTTAVC
jgi:hypothetical protein